MPLNYSCRPTWSLCQELIVQTSYLWYCAGNRDRWCWMEHTRWCRQVDEAEPVAWRPHTSISSISPMDAWVVTTEQRITQDNRQLKTRVKTGCFLDVNLTGLFAPESGALQLPNKNSSSALAKIGWGRGNPSIRCLPTSSTLWWLQPSSMLGGEWGKNVSQADFHHRHHLSPPPQDCEGPEKLLQWQATPAE